MGILESILVFLCLLALVYLIIKESKYSEKINELTNSHKNFIESIEKYTEIFNEQNINKYLNDKSLTDETLASEKIKAIKEEYAIKLATTYETLTEEHEMLVDFVTLTLSLLIKTPPNLRERFIIDNTDNDIIKKILLSKLESIQKHYIPVSLIEIAISKEAN